MTLNYDFCMFIMQCSSFLENFACLYSFMHVSIQKHERVDTLSLLDYVYHCYAVSPWHLWHAQPLLRSCSGDLATRCTTATEHAVKVHLGHRTRVACIGPAGERLVRYAAVTNDGGRQAARTGPGAVLGSQNLKALAVRETRPVSVLQPDALHAIATSLTQRSLKGLEMPGYEPRSLQTMALSLAVSTRGACHHRLALLPEHLPDRQARRMHPIPRSC
jgi:Aldehyde ferredoxin oxidoreductase, N-terminal domain/Aldehyde ferredoxin oxidoreductase, domains 2 & 3